MKLQMSRRKFLKTATVTAGTALAFPFKFYIEFSSCKCHHQHD